MESIAQHTAYIERDIWQVTEWAEKTIVTIVGDVIAMGGIPYKDDYQFITYHTDLVPVIGTWRATVYNGHREMRQSTPLPGLCLYLNSLPLDKVGCLQTLVTIECFHPALVFVYDLIVNALDVKWPKAVQGRDSDAGLIRRGLDRISASVTAAAVEAFEVFDSTFDLLSPRHVPVSVEASVPQLNSETVITRDVSGRVPMLTPNQRRRMANIPKAHDLKAADRHITRKEIACALGVSLRTVDSYLKAPCNRRNCAYCAQPAR